MTELTQDYFTLLGIPAEFSLELTTLAQNYRQLQRQFHPDRHTQADPQQQRLAMQYTAQLNHAYQTLKDPLQRAAYMLQQQGVDLEMENNTQMPMDFLMQQMQWREALDEIKHSSDPLTAIDQLAQEIQPQRQQWLTELAQAVSDDVTQAALLLRKLWFMRKLDEELQACAEQWDH